VPGGNERAVPADAVWTDTFLGNASLRNESVCAGTGQLRTYRGSEYLPIEVTPEHRFGCLSLSRALKRAGDSRKLRGRCHRRILWQRRGARGRKCRVKRRSLERDRHRPSPWHERGRPARPGRPRASSDCHGCSCDCADSRHLGAVQTSQGSAVDARFFLALAYTLLHSAEMLGNSLGW